MKLWLYILLFLLMFFSIFRMIGESVYIGAYGAYTTYGLLLISIILYKSKKIKYNKILLTLVLFFTFFSVVSALFNGDLGMVLQSFLFLLLFISTSIMVDSYFNEKTIKRVGISFFLSVIPLIALPFIVNGVDSFPYSGIFDNPNSFGIVAVTAFSILMGVMMSKLEKYLFAKNKPSKLSIFTLFILGSITFIFIVFSASRSSFIAGILVLIVGISMIFIFSVKHRKFFSMVLKSLLLTPLIAGLYFAITKFIPINYYVDAIILNKFDRKSGNLLDGRTGVWSRTMNDAGFFGRGEGYFEELGLGAHNTFIYIMGVYGLIPLSIFVLFFAVSLYYCVKFVLSSSHAFKYMPLCLLITFLALSMTENQMFKITMVVAFIFIGVASNNKKVLITR